MRYINLEVGQKILDYMGSTELITNLFRIVHYNVGKEVRTAIEKIGGTMPDDMPKPEKSIQQVEREQMARLKDKAKKVRLCLMNNRILKLPM